MIVNGRGEEIIIGILHEWAGGFPRMEGPV